MCLYTEIEDECKWLYMSFMSYMLYIYIYVILFFPLRYMLSIGVSSV